MRIYLAGGLFTLAERLFNNELATQLRLKGYAVFNPQENEPREFSTGAIFTMDKSGIDRSDVILANMDGADPDSGTAWECGYGYAKGKMVVTYRTDFRSVGEAKLCEYNIMLWEGSDHRVLLSCLMCPTIEVLANTLDQALQNTRHVSLTQKAV
ncbi:MAG: nucleoside 2-deoxyribosyltransferase [Candidatus Acidiferrum sp.]